MKRLSKDQLKQRTEFQDLLRAEADKVIAAVAKVNELIDNVLNPAIDGYNSVVADVETFRDELTGEMENYADERSDKWRDSDAGSNYECWKGDWENLDTSELEQVDNVDEPDMSHADNLEGLPEEPEGI